MTLAEDSERLERTRLNQETARIRWAELQRFFARGVVIWVRPGVDLIDAALAFSADNRGGVEAELARGGIAKVTDAQARDWLAGNAELWAVVVKPWVLIQEVVCESGSTPTPALR
jgi:hypothetical protein